MEDAGMIFFDDGAPACVVEEGVVDLRFKAAFAVLAAVCIHGSELWDEKLPSGFGVKLVERAACLHGRSLWELRSGKRFVVEWDHLVGLPSVRRYVAPMKIG